MLIGLTGPKQAGKDTVYERAAHIMADVLPVERVSFADLLYESAAAGLGVTVDELRQWKNDRGVFVAVGAYFDDGTFFPADVQTIRTFLQRYGTEAHRDIFGPDFWVERVNLEHDGKLVFATDVRFESEARAIQGAGGAVVRVVGPADIEGAGDGHASEAGLSRDLVDGFLFNTERDDGYRSLDLGLQAFLKRMLQGQT